MKLGIIGCGNMGSAIANGILSKKIIQFNNIFISDKDASKSSSLSKKFGARVSTNEELVEKSNFIIIAVKPQDSRQLLSSIAGSLDNSKHLISVMAGVTIAQIEGLCKKKIAITRAMPSMTALAGKGVTCLSHNRLVKDKTSVNKIFSSIGDVLEIDEGLMDAVTAIVGSGPAYFYYLAESLMEAAQQFGIKKESAIKLVEATLAGSGALLETMALPVEALRERITSKKGTTEAAMNVLKTKKFKEMVIEAAKAAKDRAAELSGGA